MLICRLCQNKIKKPFLSLGKSPLANSFLSIEDLKQKEIYYPLEVYVCDQCFLVQVDEFEMAENIFNNHYAYFSSYSDTWLKHSQDYVDTMTPRFNLTAKSLVVEIASNDGYLLQYFKKKDIPILGIEPARNTAEIAIQKGIPTDIDFFRSAVAKRMVKNNQKADLIIGNNVLAHDPKLNDFVAGLKILLKPTGVITLEFPHLLKLLDGNQFDTIYHEHFSYFSFCTASKLFSLHNLKIFDVEEMPTHGGSLRIFLKHPENMAMRISPKTTALLKREKEAGILEPNTYSNFSQKVVVVKEKLLQTLHEIKKQGKRIVGYGAPAKGNTLLNYCGVTSELVEYTVDLNPFKQNKFLPGTHIPIKHPDEIKKDKPDYILILPWNIKQEIMKQLHEIRSWGGKFVIPIPSVEVI